MILLTDLIRNLSDDCNRVSTREALEHAENQGHVLCCYANPMDDGREGLTVDEAEAIAREDIGLIYTRPDMNTDTDTSVANTADLDSNLPSELNDAATAAGVRAT